MNSKNHQHNLLSAVRLYLHFMVMLLMVETSWFDTNLTMELLTAECVHDFIMPRTHLTPCACIFENQPGQTNYQVSTLGSYRWCRPRCVAHTDLAALLLLPPMVLIQNSGSFAGFFVYCLSASTSITISLGSVHNVGLVRLRWVQGILRTTSSFGHGGVRL